MTRDDFYKLRMGDVVYDARARGVYKLASHYTDDKRIWEDTDVLSLTGIGVNDDSYIYAKECEYWHRVDDESPIEVRFELLTERFFELESFVYQRLK